MTRLNWEKARERATRQLDYESVRESRDRLGRGEILKGMPKEARLDLNSPPCPLCGKKMTPRYRRLDGKRFWGCSNYPSCKGLRKVSTVSTSR